VKLSVVLPAYNEEETIGAALDAVLSVDLSSLPESVEKEVIVVDDASRDRTPEIAASKAGVILVRHDRNKGKGAAIRTALEHVTGDVVLVQDADMEYSMDDYPALLRPFLEEDARVVFGSRFLTRRRPAGMRFANYLANRILTAAANILFGAGITDEATCFKVLRTDLMKDLPLRADGFDFCPEVTSLVRLWGVPIREVPIAYRARTRAEGKKVRWTDGVQALQTMLLYRLGIRSARKR